MWQCPLPAEWFSGSTPPRHLRCGACNSRTPNDRAFGVNNKGTVPFTRLNGKKQHPRKKRKLHSPPSGTAALVKADREDSDNEEGDGDRKGDEEWYPVDEIPGDLPVDKRIQVQVRMLLTAAEADKVDEERKANTR